jgi:hypothetical protein
MHSGEAGLWGLFLEVATVVVQCDSRRFDALARESWENDGGAASEPPPTPPTATEVLRAKMRTPSGR